MPTTRAARRAAARKLTDLSLDELALILCRLPLAHNIALAGLACGALRDAAKLALKARRFSSEVATINFGTRLPRASVITPCGHIIVGLDDGSIDVYPPRGCRRTIPGRGHAVISVAALPDGRFITGSGSGDGFVRTFDLNSTLERTVNLSLWNVVATMPDGEHFLVGCGGHPFEVRLYHVDGTLVHTFKGHTQGVRGLTVTQDGQHIISGSFDHTVKVWSAESKSLLSTCRGHTDYVFVVAAMPDGQRILSGARDKTIRVWQLDGTLENTFDLHTNTECSSLFALVALPDNQHALTGLHDIKLFDVNDGAVLRTFAHHDAAASVSAGLRWPAVISLALLPDGLRFVSTSNDKTARIAYHGLAA